mmetsp:Transcript_71791/g.149955  ORF Transcript_71791/g.149955 Transcript_71791/m.149955 type:complete len:177 (-) Transcript_71791:62-592(-)
MGYLKQYQVIGRKLPSEAEPEPTLLRMHIFARDKQHAVSRFWYFVSQYRKLKKTAGETVSVNEIFEKNDRIVKNFGIQLRYISRSGTHNMYKEYRDTTLCGAVEKMYAEMAGTHRARFASIQIIRTATVDAADARRASTRQFHNSKIKFPLTHVVSRASSKTYEKTFHHKRPTTFA